MATNINEDTSEDEEIYDKEIFSKTLSQYRNFSNESEIKTNQFLNDILQTGALTCLVCIDNVKRLDAIWSCVNCFCILHLPCIQKWAKEGTQQQQLGFKENFEKEDTIWNCPKCRFEYKSIESLINYMCFCGKEKNPSFDPWIVPHSCGQTCLKNLFPNCGHECILLCHPGPCPPCPKTVLSTCYCEKSQPQLQRCSKKGWSCGKLCGKLYSCAIHYCEDFCHSGDCSPCPKMGNYFCFCKKVQDVRPCAEKNWSCKQICHKVLSCGHHLCEKECHSTPCGDCPRSGSRKCPCGKTFFSLPCLDDVTPCKDICLKQLSCGAHQCYNRCHYGPCEACNQVVRKTCKCGRKTKDTPCSQTLTCEFKCTKLRKCGRHPCKKKCCDGNCRPCDQLCNRLLNCNNHKCLSPCHSGKCYPCPLRKGVSCFCGITSILVQCGKEKSVKPPFCKEQCRIPSTCHHEKKIHSCHFGECLQCTEICGKMLPCLHSCQFVCHDRVINGNTKEESIKDHSVKDLSKDCPPCSFIVEKFCIGEHSVETFPCFEVKAYSCKHICGRLLSCENHVCQKVCHVVKGSPSHGKAGKNCIACKELCTKPRNCKHSCKLTCHPGECPPCDEYLKMDCHCRLLKVYVKCQEYIFANENQKEEILSCKSRCFKVIQCGHFCQKLCHQGSCSDSLSCQEKSFVSCLCGRKKKALLCREAFHVAELECDEQCIDTKKKQEVISLVNSAQIQKDEKELILYENRKKGRRRIHKQQNRVCYNVEKNFFVKHAYLCKALLILIISIFVSLIVWLLGIL
ncbi:NF-X1-type zinc finger protein NFXL1 isoform X1 [Hydra vulgaris]|uniref:NF-X1-type zinc finger protein NFXL1 isoform X1 n=1 Tax=Hydra vulgaris TaxID=6087 RepID=UPI001F5E999E|nr:NF-X1-type zinc finger protein NFXL1-like isoform X1 [Hydra vulgaris]